ncbi:hypothetical protein MMC08_004414 [Hypocenomyce scalaris]|nr:hypothetical protein [Hypocenomyce scalaris]
MASFSASDGLDLLSLSSKKQRSRRSPTNTSLENSLSSKGSYGNSSQATLAIGARKTRPPQILIVPSTEPHQRTPTSTPTLNNSSSVIPVPVPVPVPVPASFSIPPSISASASPVEQTAATATVTATAPIAIPTANPPHRRDTISRPTTPLTAREEKGGHGFPWHDTSPLKPTISQSLRPTYSFQNQRQRKTKELSPKKQQIVSKVSLRMQESENAYACAYPSTEKHQIGSKAFAYMRKENASSLYTPSSPLSPTMASSTTPSQSRHSNPRRAAQTLQLPALPRYHPSNYERATPSLSQSSNASHPSATHRSSARSPQPHQRQPSDAQQKLHQYQRDLITSAMRVPRSVAPSANSTTRPVSPRLNPLGSPGPVTPMMLEEQGDYLLAGTQSRGLSPGPGGLGEGGQRDLVERLIRAGNDPGALARSGSNSPVSPAGGRG